MDVLFKIGDRLVAKDPNSQCDDIFEVERIGANGEIYDTKWRMLIIENLRRAKPEEIQANKRLNT